MPNAHPTRGGPSRTVPARQTLRARAPDDSAVTPYQRPGAVEARIGGEQSQPTGGRAEQASNTARGTLERRRTCGLNTPDRPGAARHRGSAGPPDPQRSALPRTLPAAAAGPWPVPEDATFPQAGAAASRQAVAGRPHPEILQLESGESPKKAATAVGFRLSSAVRAWSFCAGKYGAGRWVGWLVVSYPRRERRPRSRTQQTTGRG